MMDKDERLVSCLHSLVMSKLITDFLLVAAVAAQFQLLSAVIVHFHRHFDL